MHRSIRLSTLALTLTTVLAGCASAPKSLDELPANARAYISRLEALIEAPIDIISTGPDRNETIVLRHPFEV